MYNITCRNKLNWIKRSPSFLADIDPTPSLSFWSRMPRFYAKLCLEVIFFWLKFGTTKNTWWVKNCMPCFFFRWNMIRDVPNFEFGSKKVRGFLGSVRAFQGPIYLEPNFLKTLILSVFESFCSFLFSSIFD